MLVALRSWRSSNATAVIFQVRSDCLSALSSILKGSSRSRNLNNIVPAILLDEAELYNSLVVTVHIPGIANIQPNALSRLSAPHHHQPSRKHSTASHAYNYLHEAILSGSPGAQKKRSPAKTQEECPLPHEATSTAPRRRSFDHCLDAAHQPTQNRRR